VNIKTKLDKLEEKYKTDATVCTHMRPVVKYFELDGTPDTTHGIPDETPCACGRDRLRIHVQYVEKWREEPITFDEARALPFSELQRKLHEALNEAP